MTEHDWLTNTDPVAMLAWACFAIRGNTTPSVLPDGYRAISARKLRLFAVACCRAVWDGLRCPAGCCVPHGGTDGVYRVHESRGPESCWVRCPTCHGSGRVGGLTDPRSWRAVEVAERYADGEATEEERSRAEFAARQACADLFSSFESELAWKVASDIETLTENAGLPRWFSVSTKYAATQAALLRDLCGNPFRPVVWKRDSCFLWNLVARPDGGIYHPVLAIARAIYDERRFEDMPILADALEEAGCTDEAILSHCRGKDAEKVCPSCEDRSPDPETNVVECSRCDCTGLIPDEDYEPLHARGCWVIDLLLGKE